jgi:MoaD family protein
MKIKVKGYFTLRKAMDNKAVLEIEMKNASLGDVLKDLSNRFGEGFSDLIFDPKTKEVKNHILILVNGRHYIFLPKRLATELKEGDEVALFPQIVGG